MRTPVTRVALALVSLALAGTCLALARPQAAAPVSGPAAPTPDRVKSLAMYEKFKAIEGAWGGKSTKGWEDTSSFKTIADGSCVMQLNFEAHPGQMMATMIHMDGDHLMLTHYCVAKNQPRLRATEISNDLKTVTFTFLDGTNLKSRDQGHMDQAVYTFDSADRFTTRWTWYQDGKEDWMEEIIAERKPATAK